MVGTVSIDIVVEDELFSSLDISLGKDAHAQLIANHPFVDVAIGITGVVAEPTKVAAFGGIDELASTERHEVEVLNAFIIVGDHSFAEGVFGNDLAYVLEDEFVGL